MEMKIVDTQCILEGKCPVCNEGISFSVDNDMRIRANQLAGQLFEWFLSNNEICFNCRVIFEKWCREHAYFCEKHGLSYREVANKFLEKSGKEAIIGINTHKEAEDEVTTELDVPVSPEGLTVPIDNTERRSKVI